MLFKSKSQRGPSIGARLFRSLLAVVILTGFVLGITFIVRSLSSFKSSSVIVYSKPVLSKVGIDAEKVSETVGQVAGTFASRFGFSSAKLNEKLSKSSKSNPTNPTVTDMPNTDNTSAVDAPIFKLAIMSDIENKWESFSTALTSLSAQNVSGVIVLGDLTSWGDMDSLNKARTLLAKSGYTYYVIPGDHDLGASVSEGDVTGLQNYTSVFGPNYHTFTIKGVKFTMLDNSANYTPVAQGILSQFVTDIKSSDFVLISQPLYFPLKNRSMGVIDGVETTPVHDQALFMLDEIRAVNVNAVISGDLHLSHVSADPVKTGMQHISIGAITDESNLQSPRYTILSVYPDKSYEVSDFVL